MLWKGFQKPKRLATDTSTLTDKYGMFWAQPFERGFGKVWSPAKSSEDACNGVHHVRVRVVPEYEG